MDDYKPFISVVMPALNEENSIAAVIDDLLSAFKEIGLTGEIIVVNDGSTDSTPLLIRGKIKENPKIISTINHDTRKGIGTSFWDGVDAARGDFVCMMPADKENDPRESFRYIKLLDDVDIIIPFTFNTNIRLLLRRILSLMFLYIINCTFFTSLNYINGTTIFRRELLKELKHRCSGFFLQTDILIRLIKRGYLFAEVPCRLEKREKGKSKAISWASLREVVKNYINLVIDIYLRKTEQRRDFFAGSVTFKRLSGK